jgi:hypothetical protein
MLFGILFGAITKTPGLFTRPRKPRPAERRSFLRRWLW